MAFVLVAALAVACGRVADEAPAASASQGPTATASGSAATATATASPSASTQQPTPSPSTEPSVAAAPPADWERVLSARVDGHSLVARPVVRGTTGFLAAAEQFVSQEGGPSLVDRMFWFSADGRSWEDVTPPLAKEDSLQVLTTTRDGDFVAITGVVDGEPGEQRTVTRRSSDGVTWHEIDTGLPDNLQIFSVDHGARGSLLIGLEYLRAGNAYGAWFSADGVQWEKVLDLDRGGSWVVVQDGGAGDDGFVVAGTVSSDDQAGHEYFAFASADGRIWLEPETAPFGPVHPGFRFDPFVAPLGPDWVAALPRLDGNIEFWLSSNGLDWSAGGVIDRGGEQLNVFSPMTGVGGNRLYFSTAGGTATPGSWQAGIWTSTDGRVWEPMPIGADAHLGGVATHDGLVVLNVTQQSESGLTEIGIWIGPAD